MKVQITRLSKKFADIPLPNYQSAGSVGMDVYAAVEDTLIIEPGGVSLVPTGIAIAIPDGYECQVRTRSGLAYRHGVFALNSPGTIDNDYRGEIKIILANFGKKPFEIHRGDRIAQLVFARYEKVEWEEVESLSQTERGEGGFGSTGL
ncbi:MAG: dUTP diphosphatase [Ignavibacteria bacterium]|nr:dUTP diphosphatase [Ignavibacteria bacterium]